MSGVVGFSRGEGWFVGGWGWRMLMESAIAVASRPEDKKKLEVSLYSHGLFFEQLSQDVRPRIAAILRDAAQINLARFSEDAGEYEPGYVALLSELVGRLEAELNANPQ